jgi:hypothetical protein
MNEELEESQESEEFYEQIRSPDPVIKERLIEDDSFYYNEFNDFYDFSLNEKKYDHGCNCHYNHLEEDEEIKLVHEMSSESIENNGYDIFEEQLRQILDLSLKEYNEHEEIDFEEIHQKIMREDKEKRRNSLSVFSKKLIGLTYTEQDRKIKQIFDKILDDYFELRINFIEVDEDIYTTLFHIIDSYYLLPMSKNKNGAIPEKEDTLLRTIIRLKTQVL